MHSNENKVTFFSLWADSSSISSEIFWKSNSSLACSPKVIFSAFIDFRSALRNCFWSATHVSFFKSERLLSAKNFRVGRDKRWKSFFDGGLKKLGKISLKACTVVISDERRDSGFEVFPFEAPHSLALNIAARTSRITIMLAIIELQSAIDRVSLCVLSKWPIE